MRTTNLILAIAALLGVGILYAQSDDTDRDEAMHQLSLQMSDLESELASLSADIAKLREEQRAEGPLLEATGSENRKAIRDLLEKWDALESGIRRRLDQQEERLAAVNEGRASVEKKPGRAEEVDRWIKRLAHKDEDIVFSGTIELARLGDRRATLPLIKVLQKHRDFYARLGAATALGELKDPRGVEPLIEGLNDKDDLVRTASAEALRKITDREFNYVSGLKRSERVRIQKQWIQWWQDNEAIETERLNRDR